MPVRSDEVLANATWAPGRESRIAATTAAGAPGGGAGDRRGAAGQGGGDRGGARRRRAWGAGAHGGDAAGRLAGETRGGDPDGVPAVPRHPEDVARIGQLRRPGGDRPAL